MSKQVIALTAICLLGLVLAGVAFARPQEPARLGIVNMDGPVLVENWWVEREGDKLIFFATAVNRSNMWLGGFRPRVHVLNDGKIIVSEDAAMGAEILAPGESCAVVGSLELADGRERWSGSIAVYGVLKTPSVQIPSPSPTATSTTTATSTITATATATTRPTTEATRESSPSWRLWIPRAETTL